ncbi:MAG: hypothetical protein WBY94_19740, partial [Polyangiaceae bacterium]
MGTAMAHLVDTDRVRLPVLSRRARDAVRGVVRGADPPPAERHVKNMNLKQAAVGLAGLIALSGCAVATNGVPSAERTRVVVFVDPAFGSQTEAALSAVDSWTQADPSLSLDVQIGACASGPSVVCIVSDPTEPGAGANGGNEVGVTARAADGSAVCRIFVNQF